MSREYEAMEVEKWVNLEDIADHLSVSTDTVRNWIKDDPKMNIICIHPGWIRTNPGNNEAPLIPYEHAETLRLLFETKRHDKEGPVFITHTGEPYPW